MLLAPAIAPPPLFPGCRYDFFNFHTYSQRILRPPESGPLFGCSFTHPFILSDLYVSPISSSAIYMFFRSHPQRFICFSDFIQRFLCFSDLILSDLNVFTISSSAIYMFFRSHPQIFNSRAMLLRAGPSCHICWAALGSRAITLLFEMLQNDPLGASWDHFASWRWKCLKTTLWMPPGTTLRAGA